MRIRIQHYLIKVSALSKKLGRGAFWLGNRLNYYKSELPEDVEKEIIKEYIDMFIYLFRLEKDTEAVEKLKKLVKWNS